MMICYIATAGLNLVWPYLSGTVLYDQILSKNQDFLDFIGKPGMKFTVALGLVVLVMLLSKITLQVLGIIQGVLTATIVRNNFV